MSSRIVSLIIVDVVLILLMVLLITEHIIPLYSGAAIFYPLLFVSNVLWILAHKGKGVGIRKDRHRVPKSLWIIAIIFSLTGLVAVVAYLENGTLSLGVQATVAVSLVGYIWFMIYCLARRG
jgi:hypothetical protein